MATIWPFNRRSRQRSFWNAFSGWVPAGLIALPAVFYLTARGAGWAGRELVRRQFNKLLRTLLSEPYPHNLGYMLTAIKRVGPETIVETTLRAQTGKPLERPFGSARRFSDFDRLLFRGRQLGLGEAGRYGGAGAPRHRPLDAAVPVDLSVTIGPAAVRPLRLQIPLIISGMAYGIGLSRQVKIALARGASMAGTATNTGAGPLLPEERRAARQLIVQVSRGFWNDDPATLRQADMVEIALGQGAWGGGTGFTDPANRIGPEVAYLMRQAPGTPATIYARRPETESVERFRSWVNWLRRVTGGVPVGVKLAACQDLESDLDFVLQAGVDVIALDGAEAGTATSPPLLQDDFGLPTLPALVRAVRHLERHGIRDRVSLIIGGGLFTPGHFLKALALGADACYLGTIPVFAVTHLQVMHSLPWEPPTGVSYYTGEQKSKFDIEEGARSLYLYLKSATEEMAQGLRSLGKDSLRQLSRADLFALDRGLAEAIGIEWAWQPASANGKHGSAATARAERAAPAVRAARTERAMPAFVHGAHGSSNTSGST